MGVNHLFFLRTMICGGEGIKKRQSLRGAAVAVREDSLAYQSYGNNLYSFFE